MDRSERYDPEDIEHLMTERSFAELLPEERAYVLRHLSGPEEYEAMRALLLHLKDGPGEEPPLDADPAVRDRVMSAFRDAQQPRWRIWLNSVGTWFIPEEGHAPWRPALALATLALLLVTTVVVVERMNSSENALAEVRPARKDQQEQLRSPQLEEAKTSDTVAPTTATEEQNAGGIVGTRNIPAEPPPIPQQPTYDDRKTERSATTIDAVSDERMSEEQERAEDRMAMSDAETMHKDVVSGHAVTLEELATNASVANATGKVRSAAPPAPMREQTAGRSRSMAQQPELLQLVAEGW